MHAQCEEHLRNRYFYQRGEIHENTENYADEISQNCILSGKGLNPLRLDQFTDDSFKVRFIWLSALAYVTCAVIRLARFRMRENYSNRQEK